MVSPPGFLILFFQYALLTFCFSFNYYFYHDNDNERNGHDESLPANLQATQRPGVETAIVAAAGGQGLETRRDAVSSCWYVVYFSYYTIVYFSARHLDEKKKSERLPKPSFGHLVSFFNILSCLFDLLSMFYRF